MEQRCRLLLRLVEEEKEARERLEERLGIAQEVTQAQEHRIRQLEGRQGELLVEVEHQQKEIVELKKLMKALLSKQEEISPKYTCSMADFHHQMEAFKQQWRSRFKQAHKVQVEWTFLYSYKGIYEGEAKEEDGRMVPDGCGR